MVDLLILELEVLIVLDLVVEDLLFQLVPSAFHYLVALFLLDQVLALAQLFLCQVN